MMQCSLWEEGEGGRGRGILSIMTRMNEKAEMSIISADLALERSISEVEIRGRVRRYYVMMQGRVALLCSGLDGESKKCPAVAGLQLTR